MSTVPSGQDVAKLRVVVGRLHRRLAQRSNGELTFAQVSALVTVEKRGPIRLGELAAREQVAAPSMTRTAASLLTLGLIDRVPDPDDGRSFHIVLADAGRDLLDHVRSERTALLSERVSRLSQDQYEKLLAALPVLEQLAEEDD
ncbi:MAG TPA: MarR family transcriptional regulator [Actinocrinis sp.]|nr:MarR family transcriptional regulator [Actinocrinis sp.]